ncbi:hypothetical protein BC938DRAFT_470983 [Jimgerdemannia flammicorona]|uniref:Uncharacterized protein n=1 Tax=Jimgerdemannia flammicorona TaxID=994334 RepID=A0A433QUW0_9FUNG|nr:hypothetical protein BC938DRAFT_470983 [Jimgerdemannia flammicorona]
MNPYYQKAPTDPTSDNTNRQYDVAITIPPLIFYENGRDIILYGASLATPDFTLKSLLQIAACNGYQKVVSLLCASASRQNCQNVQYYACKRDHIDTMGGHSALHICVYHGNLQLVKMLVVEFQACVDIVDKLFRETPLHYATWSTGYFHFRSSGCKIYDEQSYST